MYIVPILHFLEFYWAHNADRKKKSIGIEYWNEVYSSKEKCGSSIEWMAKAKHISMIPVKESLISWNPNWIMQINNNHA